MLLAKILSFIPVSSNEPQMATTTTPSTIAGTRLEDVLLADEVCSGIMSWIMDAADWYRLVVLAAPNTLGVRIMRRTIHATVDLRRPCNISKMAQDVDDKLNFRDEPSDKVVVMLRNYVNIPYPLRASIAIVALFCSPIMSPIVKLCTNDVGPRWPRLKRLSLLHLFCGLSRTDVEMMSRNQITDLVASCSYCIPPTVTHLDLIGIPNDCALRHVFAPSVVCAKVSLVGDNDSYLRIGSSEDAVVNVVSLVAAIMPNVQDLMVKCDYMAYGRVKAICISLDRLPHLTCLELTGTIRSGTFKPQWIIRDAESTHLETLKLTNQDDMLSMLHATSQLPSVKHLVLGNTLCRPRRRSSVSAYRFADYIMKYLPNVEELVVADRLTANYLNNDELFHSAGILSLDEIDDKALQIRYEQRIDDQLYAMNYLPRLLTCHPYGPRNLATLNFSFVKPLLRTRWWAENAGRITLVADFGNDDPMSQDDAPSRIAVNRRYELTGWNNHRIDSNLLLINLSSTVDYDARKETIDVCLRDLHNPARMFHPPLALNVAGTQRQDAIIRDIITMPVGLWRNIQSVTMNWCELTFHDIVYFSKHNMPCMAELNIQSGVLYSDERATVSGNEGGLSSYVRYPPDYLWRSWLSQLPNHMRKLTITLELIGLLVFDTEDDTGTHAAVSVYRSGNNDSNTANSGSDEAIRTRHCDTGDNFAYEHLVKRQALSMGHLLHAYPHLKHVDILTGVFVLVPDYPSCSTGDICMLDDRQMSFWWRQYLLDLLYDHSRWVHWPKTMAHLTWFKMNFSPHNHGHGGLDGMLLTCLLESKQNTPHALQDAGVLYIKWIMQQYAGVLHPALHVASETAVLDAIIQWNWTGFGTTSRQSHIGPMPYWLINRVWHKIPSAGCKAHARTPLGVMRTFGTSKARYHQLDFSSVRDGRHILSTDDQDLLPCLPWMYSKIDCTYHRPAILPTLDKTVVAQEEATVYALQLGCVWNMMPDVCHMCDDYDINN